jgi:integrase
MATLENRGNSVRLNWRLGGTRDGARQSCTFSGPPHERDPLVELAKHLVEARGHNVTRAECYSAVLGNDPTLAEDVIPTFRAWVDTWLEARERARDIEPQTIKNYRWVLHARVIPRLGHYRLTEIDDTVIQEWVAWMASRRTTRGNRNRNTTANQLLSAQTIGKAYRVLHSCLGGAVPKWIPANPASRPKGTRKGHAGLPKPERFEGMFLHPEEIDLIVANCDPLIVDIVKVGLGTGMRLGELLALEAQHVTRSPTQVVVQVRQTLHDDGTIGPPKSAAGIRSLPVDEATGLVLQDRAMGRRPRDLLFTNPYGVLWTEDNFRKQYWWPAVARAQRCAEHPPPERVYGGRGRRPQLGVHDVSTCACTTRLHRRPRPHDLRHTHASALINAKWSPKKVQVRMGHADFSTTMSIYAHLWDLGEIAELEAVARLLGSAA